MNSEPSHAGPVAVRPNGIVDSGQVVQRARFCFRECVGESYGRHIRALERHLIYDESYDLARIHVVHAPKMPTGIARLAIMGAEYEKATGETVLLPGERASARVILKHVFIVVGVEGIPPAKREIGRDLPTHEYHLTPAARLALGHELGHLALGHLVDSEGQLRVPRDLSERHSEEDAAKLYAVALAAYTRSYLSQEERVSHLKPDSEQVLKAAEQIWGAQVAPDAKLGREIRKLLSAEGLPKIDGFDNER